jgi:hypothetical protein
MVDREPFSELSLSDDIKKTLAISQVLRLTALPATWTSVTM